MESDSAKELFQSSPPVAQLQALLLFHNYRYAVFGPQRTPIVTYSRLVNLKTLTVTLVVLSVCLSAERITQVKLSGHIEGTKYDNRSLSQTSTVDRLSASVPCYITRIALHTLKQILHSSACFPSVSQGMAT